MVSHFIEQQKSRKDSHSRAIGMIGSGKISLEGEVKRIVRF